METKDLTVEMITPAMAESYLKEQRNNRAMKPRLVSKYARMMESGKWHTNGETIKFDVNGKLCDGQHRLMALMVVGKALQFCVARNVSDEGILDVDTGGNRTAGDIFQFNNVPNAKDFAAAIHKYFFLKYHQIIIENPNPVSIQCNNAELLEIYNDNVSEWHRWLLFARGCYKQYFVLSPALIVAYSFYLVHDLKHTANEVEAFFTQLCYQKDVSMQVMTLFFRRMMQERGMKRSRMKMTAGYKQGIFIKTWNAYVTKKDLQHLSYNPDRDKGVWFV